VSMESDVARVISDVILGPCDRPVLFMKQMAHHLVEIDHSFMQHTANVLLIRDPVEMLPSLAGVLETPRLQDTGFAAQYALLQELRNLGQNPPIIDAKELLLNPASVLKQLCQRLGIAFEPAMLCWEPGPRPEDGVWAKYWYGNVHRSNGFQPYAPKTAPFPDRLKPLLQECMPYYNALSDLAIKADGEPV